MKRRKNGISLMILIYLEVRISNVAAIYLYKGLGFKNVGVRKDYYFSESGRKDAQLMELKITE